uniref:Splicing factor 3A subunit 1 n=1 Tax=Tetraselmis sp. GSL018 TaxID=582737 RepID=A0A061QIM6_9CHLO|mmetsp:Transcript_14218/g.33639  ORF Transcript_14218/g.33639 Transcript_14218/m.33639 type:complete len:765 (+) Transcript_14218:169-2463(+)
MVAEEQNGAVVAQGEAKDALPKPDLTGLRAPETHTKVVGVIYPPPDIRAIVDKTASFVARNGTEFEKRILSNEKQNQKFSFLLPTDPYHAYYQMKVKEIKEGGEKPAGEQAAAPDQEPAQAAKEPEKPVVPPTKPLEPPAPELYMVHVPEGLTMLDLDVIKLTAQFVARNGKSFLTGLAQREHMNSQFNFLKPTHSMFTFFTALADAYSKVLMPPKGTLENCEKDSKDRDRILERCLKRLEWERHKEAEAKAIADEEEAERIAMASIDWHDFVVVETIEFDPAEDDELPAPMTSKEIIALSKAQPYEADENEQDNEAEMEMEMDEEEKEMVKQASEVAAAPPVPDAPPENIKVVKNYKRTAQGQSYDPTKYVVSPITGELVPIDQMAEHMRISLIDPRWKDQREAMLSKIKTTTKADDDEISRNIVILANTRPDIFGSTEEEMSAVVQETIKERRATGQGEQPTGAANGGEGEQPGSSGPRANEGFPPPPQMKPSQPFPPYSQAPHSQAPQQLPVSSQAPMAPLRPPQGGYYAPRPNSLPPPPGMPPPPGNASFPPPPGMGFPPPPQFRPPTPMMPQNPSQHQGPLPPPPQSQQQHQQQPPHGFPPSMPPPLAQPVSSNPPSASSAPMPMAPPPQFPQLPTDAPPPMPPVGSDKRARQEFVLRPEADILAEHPGAIKVRVAAPDVEGNDKLNGQILEVEMPSLSETVGDLKARLAGVIGLGANKQKLTRDEVGVMRDNLSLAHYNVLEDVQLTLGIKERGRGKK